MITKSSQVIPTSSLMETTDGRSRSWCTDLISRRQKSSKVSSRIRMSKMMRMKASSNSTKRGAKSLWILRIKLRTSDNYLEI